MPPILLIDVSKVGSMTGCAEVVFEGNVTVFIGRLAPILGSGYPFLSYLISSFPHISLSSFTFTTWLTCTLNMKAVCLKHDYMVSQSRLQYESSPCQGWNAVITLPLSPYCLYVKKVRVACF